MFQKQTLLEKTLAVPVNTHDGSTLDSTFKIDLSGCTLQAIPILVTRLPNAIRRIFSAATLSPCPCQSLPLPLLQTMSMVERLRRTAQITSLPRDVHSPTACTRLISDGPRPLCPF